MSRLAIADAVLAAGPVKLVLVRGPAGFGKTTTMQQLRERFEAAGLATAWLGLESADNDLPRFLRSLREATALLLPQPARWASPLDAIRTLSSCDTPFVLFLDDVEAIRDPSVIGLLREMVDKLPRRGQIVVGSRSLPDLGIGRLRARGELVEVGVEQLRFASAEAADLFRQLGLDLTDAHVRRLHEKTEGWIAALRLASLVVGRRGAADGFIESFDGSTDAVAEYLSQDVLEHQPEDAREFLLCTSVLRHLSLPACQSLLPQLDCARLFDALVAGGVFLTPVPGQAGVFRYHSLFGGFLRAQLERKQPGRVQRLHLAASGWYESQGRPVPAIDHAIEGEDCAQALQLLDSHAQEFLELGRMRLLDRWFDAIAQSGLALSPVLAVTAVWAMCFTRGPWDAHLRLEAAGVIDSADEQVRAHVNALRPLLLAMMDRYEEAAQAGEAGLSALPTCVPFADSVLLNAMANAVMVLGRSQEAQQLLDSARRMPDSGAFNRMYTESIDGVADLVRGRLRQATARFRLAVSATPRTQSYAHTNGNAWAGVLYAGAVYEVNEVEEADHLLNAYLPLARDVGLPDHMIESHRIRARIAFGRGDVQAAHQTLSELEYLGHQRQLPRVVASARLERARVFTLQGNSVAAREELTRAAEPALWAQVGQMRLLAHDSEDIFIGEQRWNIRFGKAVDAVAALQGGVHRAVDEGRMRRALKLRTLLALALEAAGDSAKAIDTMCAVLVPAAAEGFVRLLADEGPDVAPLVARAVGSLPDRGRDPVVVEHAQRILEHLGWTGESAASEEEGPRQPLEPLTRKEIDVLQLLAEGYSNTALAEKLFVSDSTVRTHLRNINMKLDTKSRTQAVHHGRRMGLIR
ncbi:MAG TPA: LuxR C-terminal-related transcriptional regulator [Ramlibacter sp.]|nr:LuxR C-terminal-related transcriptional regulator [Ramlibacter sp.]